MNQILGKKTRQNIDKYIDNYINKIEGVNKLINDIYKYR